MSLSDQQWCPTSVQVTVLQARGLRIKGKSGTNDAYAVMQVGKEKYQTSVVEKSVAPVWKEEAAFDLPQLLQGGGGGGTDRSTLHVHVLHRALVGPDKLLGQAVINLLQLSEDKTRNKSEWFKLLDKTGKADKDRGQVLVDIQFMRNNMTASMFDLSGAGKSRSRLGKLKDKVRGKKKESDTMSSVVPSFTQVLTDSEEEANGGAEVAAGKDEKKKKHKMKSLFSPKTNLQKNMSQSMSVLPAKNSTLSGSQSSGLNVDSSEGKKKFKFKIHKRSGSSDSKDSSSGPQKHAAAEQSNLCINGSHIYREEPPPRTSRIGSNYSLASSGHGSMEDVPESSPPSVDSLRAVRQYSPWTEEEEEETAEAENTKEDVDEMKREEEENIRMEEERRRKEEEGERVRRQEIERLAEEKRRLEEEEKRIEEEEERIRMAEERAQEERRRQEEERKLAEEKRRLEEEERRIEEEEERIRMAEERAQEEMRRQEEEHKLAEEKRRLEEEERRIEEEKVRKEEEVKRRRMEEEERAQEEKRRQEEEERARREEEQERLAEERRLQEEKRRIEEENVRKEEERAWEERRRREEDERARREEERERLVEEKRREEQERRIEEEEKRQREEEERLRVEEERAQEERRQEEEERAWREERKLEEKRRLEEEEERRRIEEEKVRRQEEERTRREEEERRRQEEEEMVRREEEREEKRRLEEQERSRREEEERIKKEEEKARREKEEYERLEEEKRKLEEEERRRIEEEEKVRREEEERIRVEEERRKEEEEERVIRQEEEKLAEEKRRLEEQERRRIEEEEKRQREEGIRKEEERRREEVERARKEKEEYERLVEEKMRQEEEERRRTEEEERIRKEEQERIRMEKERRIEEEERIRREENAVKEKKEEEARKLEKEKVTRDAEEQKKTENKTKPKAGGMTSKVKSPAKVTSTNPFDEDFSNEPFEESPDSTQQRSQSAVSSLGNKTTSTVEKDLISAQREKRLAPQPPGRNQAETQSQDGSARHPAQIDKQSKDVKTVSVLPQRSVQMIAPLSRSPTDAKNTQSLTQSSATKGTTNVVKHSKRPAPSIPAEEGPSPEPKTALSSGGKISNGCGSEAKQEPIVYGSNPFDDEDENELTPQDDTTRTGSIQWPPATQAKIKSSKMARAPPLPAKTISTSSTLINQNTEGDLFTDDTGVTVPDTHPRDPEHVQESPPRESQPAMVQSAGEEAGVKKEGPPTTSRRLQPVKPLNPSGQQPVSVVQAVMDNKSTGMRSEVQEKTKVNDTELKGPYSQLTREELVSLVLKQENQLSERDKKISELEQYIDNLLVRVIEEQPSILMSMNSLKKPV